MSGAHPLAASQQNIRLLLCGNHLGTGFIVAKNRMVTALHVVSTVPCQDAVTGNAIKVLEKDTRHDYALLEADTRDIKPIQYSCDRYKNGRTYTSIGYGQGNYQLQRLTAMSDYTTKNFTVEGSPIAGMRAFIGVIVPGMSGGPIIDDRGVAHGLNNVTSPGFGYSFELADTPLCATPIAQPLPPLYLDKSLP